MKTSIKRMGAIREGEIEIKPLTVFIGPNNSGKTWAAYGISSIFSPFSLNIYTQAYLNGSLEENYPEIEQLIETLFDKRSANIDIIEFFNNNCDFFFNNLAKFSSSWMSKFLATNTVSFGNSSITINVENEMKHARDTLLCLSLDAKALANQDNELILRIYKRKEESSIFFEIYDKINENFSKEISDSIYKLIFRYMNQALYYNVRYLPAERTGFVVLLASGIENIKNEGKKDVIVADKSSYSDNIEFLIPYPIQNMFKLLFIMKKPAELNENLKKRMEDKNLEKFFGLASTFETRVMGGKLKYEEGAVNNGISNLYYRFNEKEDLPLEMSVVSSTIKDLTPLSIYLKCFLNENELLVIDEPEMNLHPANQARFMEFLVMLVNSKINVMITTHSPYMANHLENLIKAYNSEKLGLENSFYLKSRDAFISKEDVSVYYFGDGDVENILGEDGDIDLDSFSEVSRDISEIYYEIE